MMPVAGLLLTKYDARVLIAFGLLTLGLAMLFMAHQFSLDVDFRTLMWASVSDRGTGVSLHTHQHRGIFLPAAGEKQRRFRAD